MTDSPRWFVVERCAFARSGLMASLFWDYIPRWMTSQRAEVQGLIYLCRLADNDRRTLAELKEEYAVRGKL